jgi:hypothetical protein
MYANEISKISSEVLTQFVKKFASKYLLRIFTSPLALSLTLSHTHTHAHAHAHSHTKTNIFHLLTALVSIPHLPFHIEYRERQTFWKSIFSKFMISNLKNVFKNLKNCSFQQDQSHMLINNWTKNSPWNAWLFWRTLQRVLFKKNSDLPLL